VSETPKAAPLVTSQATLGYWSF